MAPQDEAAAIEASRSDAWFAVKVMLGGLALHFVFGTLPVILFFAGYLLCGSRLQLSLDGDDIE
jgi:hypothetical protein